MKTRSMEQIQNMKKQTFGVEIEMYDITKDKAVEVIAKHYGTEQTCSISGNGWICKDAKGRTWKATRDGSISAPATHQTELETPVLTYDDLEDFQQIIRDLRAAGAKSDPAHTCGVHIHIGLDGHDAKSLRNLANLMSAHERLLIDALQLSRNRIGQYCMITDPRFLQELNDKKPKTMKELGDIWYNTQDRNWTSSHYNSSRYHMLNYHGAFEDAYYNGTIEFRLFQFDNPGRTYKGGLHAGKMKAYIQLCLALSQQAKDLKTASPKQPQRENDKYAMRTWLLRLGMIGEEFSTARMVLTKKLNGNSAWRAA